MEEQQAEVQPPGAEMPALSRQTQVEAAHPTDESIGQGQRKEAEQERNPPRRRERRSRATVQSDQPQMDEIMRKLQDIEAANRRREAEFTAKLDSMTKEMERLEQARGQGAARPVPMQRPAPQPPSQSSVPVGPGESSRPVYTCWNCGQLGHLSLIHI